MRFRPSGAFQLDLPAATAIGLFTPEGERSWVSDWDPHYPAGEPSETPGTVFTTASGSVSTTWIIIELARDAGRADHARITPGLHAGRVSVRVSERAADECEVEVRYDMTLFAEAPGDALAPYHPDRFRLVRQEWETAIRTYLNRTA